jgi:hypothetical protein
MAGSDFKDKYDKMKNDISAFNTASSLADFLTNATNVDDDAVGV